MCRIPCHQRVVRCRVPHGDTSEILEKLSGACIQQLSQALAPINTFEYSQHVCGFVFGAGVDFFGGGFLIQMASSASEVHSNMNINHTTSILITLPFMQARPIPQTSDLRNRKTSSIFVYSLSNTIVLRKLQMC